MNVLQVGKYVHPDVGGVEVAVHSLAEGLSRDHSVRILGARREQSPQPSGGGDGPAVVPVRSLGELQSVPIAPTFPLRLRRAARWADVVHYHLPNPLAVLSHLSVVPRDVPTVATYHSDIVRQHRALRAYRPVLDRFLDRLDHVLVTSRPLLEHSGVLSPHAENCSVVPLSVPVDVDATDSPPPHDLEDRPAGSGDPVLDAVDGPVVLFVGRLVYYKGVECLLAAMASVDATLVVVGDGPLRSRLREVAARGGIDDRVVFLGHVDELTLDRCYERADVFVLPSIAPSEAFGIVQLEAMVHSTPVVNTALPTGVPWVSRDGETGITVPPADPDRLAEAITELLTHPDRRARYGANARRRVVERFSRDRRIADVTAVYRRLLDEE